MPVQDISLTDYGTEAESIRRRRRLAEMLQQQSQEPLQQPQMQGGWAIPASPLAGLAKMVQAYGGAKGMQRSDAEMKALAERLRGERQQDWSTLAQGMQGRPEEVMPEGVQGPPQPGRPAGQVDPALIAQLRTPEAQSAAMQMYQKQMQPQQIGSGGLMMPGGQVIPPAARPQQTKPERWSEPYQLGGATVQRNLDTGQVRTAVTREPRTTVHVPPPVTAVTIQDPNNPNGTLIIDGRTRQVLGKGPKLTDTGRMDATRSFNMQGLGAVIQEAENILSGTAGRPLPTGSGVGTAVDYVGSLVGVSPSGAREADQLRAVSGALVSKMPRMEGPQSDKDVALYKEAAGRVGDSTLPVERRKAALETVKALWSKYETSQPQTFVPPGTQMPQGGGLPSPQDIDAELRRRTGGG